MKKAVLKKVDLVKFKEFIDSLVPLSESGTIYFKINDKYISTDSHNESGTIIKSMKTDLSQICESSNLSEIKQTIKLCFYEGKKVLKAFSFLSGNEINLEINFTEFEDELYAESMKIASPKVSISLDAADPSLFEFANVPEESIAEAKDISDADCQFKMTSNEMMQIKKFCDIDTNEEIEIIVNDKVSVASKGSFNIDITDNEFTGLGKTLSYKISKELIRLIDANHYIVYPIFENKRIVFKAEDNSIDVVVTLHEDFEI
jgi:hypothetical protein